MLICLETKLPVQKCICAFTYMPPTHTCTGKKRVLHADMLHLIAKYHDSRWLDNLKTIGHWDFLKN